MIRLVHGARGIEEEERMIRFCDATLTRKLWIESACEALKDYRAPDHEVTALECAGLAAYADDAVSPATAAELYQAANG